MVSSSLLTPQMMCCITPKSNYLWGDWQQYSIHHQLNTYDKKYKKAGLDLATKYKYSSPKYSSWLIPLLTT